MLLPSWRALALAPLAARCDDAGSGGGHEPLLRRDAICCGKCCEEHSDPFECPDYLVYYSAEPAAYGLIVHDGGSSYVLIRFCPWCGARLLSPPCS